MAAAAAAVAAAASAVSAASAEALLRLLVKPAAPAAAAGAPQGPLGMHARARAPRARGQERGAPAPAGACGCALGGSATSDLAVAAVAEAAEVVVVVAVAATAAALRKCTLRAAALSQPGGRAVASDDGRVARRRGRARGRASPGAAAPPAARSDALRAAATARARRDQHAQAAPKPRPRLLERPKSPREPLELELLEMERRKPRQSPRQRDEGGHQSVVESRKAGGAEEGRTPRASTAAHCKAWRLSLCSNVSELGSRTEYAGQMGPGDVRMWRGKSTLVPSADAAIARAWSAASTMR